MDAPTSTGIPTQPAPLKPWKQVAEESNIFSLPPEQRLAEYDKWSSQVVEQGIKNGDFDSRDAFNQFKLKDIRTRKNLASDDIIGPSDDEVVADYNAFKGAFASTQTAFSANKPTPQDEAIQGEVLQGKRKSAFVRGQMVFNPAVVNDPQKYREAILESDAPSDIKMFYAGLRPEMEKSATVTRRRELANNVITRDVADKVVTAIQEGTELFGVDIGTPQSQALKKNKDGIWSVVDPEYSDKETSFLGRANAKYNPLADSLYKPIAAINEYQKKYGLTDEQVQQDYMESLIENAPTSVNRWFGKATSIEDYVKQLDSTVRVKNKDVAPEVRVQDPNLFFDPEGYNAAVDKAKAPDEAKTFAKEVRTQFADAVAGDIYNNLLNNRDDFREGYAKDVVDRKDMEKAITRYYKDKKDQAWYDDVGEMFGQAGTALKQGGMDLMMMPSAIKGMFGDVEAAEDYRYYTLAQKGEMQAEEAVANRTGGAGFIKLNNDVMRIIPDLVVQMGIAVATGGTLSGAQASLIAARTGISRAAATTALRQAALTGEKTALKSQLLRLIPEVTAKTVDDVAEEVLKASARTASNNPFKGGIGTQRAVGSAYAGLTSASSTFGQVYTDVRNMGKSPEESIATARTAAVVAGAITSGLTHSFGMLGRGGVEDFASMGRKAGEFTIKDIVNAGLLDSLTTQEGRQLMLNIAKGISRDALSEGAEEGLDQALNLISQYATNPSPEAQNRKATDIINESLYATLLGGIAGGGAASIGQTRATAPGITAQQIQQEVLGAQQPVAPNVAPPVSVAPNVAPAPQSVTPAPVTQPQQPITPSAAVSPITPEEQANYDAAKAVVIAEQNASISLLQRKLRLGYGRAQRIMDLLEQDGVIAPKSGTGAQSVLVQPTAPAVQPSADPVVQEAQATVESLAEIPDTSQTAAALAALANAAAVPKPEFDLPEIEAVKPAPEPEIQSAEEPVVQPEPTTPEVVPVNAEETPIEPTSEPAKVEQEPTENMKTETKIQSIDEFLGQEGLFDLPKYAADQAKRKAERTNTDQYLVYRIDGYHVVEEPSKSDQVLALAKAPTKTKTKEIQEASNGLAPAKLPKDATKIASSPTREGIEKQIAKFYAGEKKNLVPVGNGVFAVESPSGKRLSTRVIQTPKGFYFVEGTAEQAEVKAETPARDTTKPEQITEAPVDDVANEAPEEAMARGDRFKDSSGQEYEVWKNRQGTIEAHPVVDGKPVVNRESTVRFSVSNAAKARNPEDRTDISTSSVVSKADVDAATEATVAETPAKPRPDVAAVRAKIKEAGTLKSSKTKVIQGLIDSGEFIPAAIEAAETGKPLAAIPENVSVVGDAGVPKRVNIDRISAPKIKATTPEVAARSGMSTDETRYVLNGVLLDKDAQKAVATDGRMLIVIPTKVDGATRIVSKNGDIIDGNYPQWQNVIPRPETKGFEVDSGEALKASIVLDGINNTFSRAYKSGGTWRSESGVRTLIKIGDAYFEPGYIKSAFTGLLQSGAKNITARVDDSLSPILLSSDNGAFVVLMPIRITNNPNYIIHELGPKSQPQQTKQDAVQEPSPDASVLRQEGQEVGLPEVDQGGRGAEQKAAGQEGEVKADPVGYGNALIGMFPSLKAAGVRAIPIEESLVNLEERFKKKRKEGKATGFDGLVFIVNKKNIQSAIEGGSIGGLWSRTENTVAASNNATPSAMAHEIGHAIMELEFEKAPEETKEAIRQEYSKWFNSTYGPDGTPSTPDQRRIWEWMEDSDWLDPQAPFPEAKRDAKWERYRSEFSEWFADEVAKWATVKAEPRSLIDKFFSELAAKLTRLWDAVRGNFSPNETLSSWLDSISQPSPAKTQPEPEAKPDLTPEQNDVVVFVDIENDTQEKAVVAAEKKKRITPGKARKVGIAKQVDRLGITSNDPESVIAALEKIAAKPPQKHHGRIAKDLLSVLKDSGVKIQLVSGNDARMAKHDSRVNGWYDPKTNTAYINLDGPHELGIEETILHELVHASGEKVIQNPQTEAQKRILSDLEKQMLAARKNAIALGQAKLGTDVTELGLLTEMAAAQNDYGLFDILYGVSSLSEYHAHATTSRSFQKFLATYKEGGKRSLFERFVNSITSLLSGKKTAEGSDAEKAYATLLDLMREGKGDVRLSNADVVQSRARGRFDLVDAVRAASSGDASTPFQALNEAINANAELTRRIQAESERRSRAYARGKGAILEQIIRAGNTGRLPEEAIKPITDFVNSVSPQALADTRISLSAKPQNSTFDFVDSLVTLALNGMGSEPGEIDRTAIHEFWHGLSRFIPDDEIEKIRKDYVAAVKEYISGDPWFVPFIGRTHLSEAQYDDLSRMLSKEEMDAIPWKNWETLEDGRRIRGLKWTKENYRLFRLDEWVAETMADLVRRKQERPTTFLGKIARLFRDFIDTLKQALGNPYLKALDAMTVPEEAFDAQIERFGPIEDNPPVMYGGEGVGMNNQFTLGMYAGEQALANIPEETRAFKRDSLEAARAMAAAGKTSEEIRAVTGWFPGKYDGKMRWEIPDAEATLNRAKVDALGKADLPRMTKAVLSGVLTDDDFIKVANLEDVLDHRALFEAYPDARKIGFGFQSEFGGTFWPEKNLITADYNSVIDDNGTLLHEIQHWIQQKEGFAKWSNPEMFIRTYPPKTQRAAVDWLVAQGVSPEEDYGYVDKNDYVKLAKSKGWDGPAFLMKPMTAYIYTAGEIEARDIDARKNLTTKQRAALAPYSEDNIAAGDAIVYFSRARSIVSDTVAKFAPEFNVVDDKDGPAVFFDGRNVTVNPDALENLDEYEVKDLSERAVVAAKAAPKDPIAASIIQQTDGYSAYNFDSASRKEIRKSLAKAHAVATENGMAPLAMDLGAKLFEYGGATDAEVRKSMARGILSAEDAKTAGFTEYFRAGDATETGVKAWASFTPEEDTANAYTDNPGFGGSAVRRVFVKPERILYADVRSRSGMQDLADAIDWGEQDWISDGWQYPWEESRKVRDAIEAAGFDAVEYEDDFPAGATTIVFTDNLTQERVLESPDIRYSSARGTEGVAYVPTKRSAPRLAVEKFFAGFRSRGMVTEDTYEIFRNSDAYKREIASFISFIGKDFSNVANKHFGEGEENWLSYRIFSRDSTGEVTVSKTGFKTAKEAESFATLNRIKDYTVATGEDLMNRALGSNGPTLSENVREKIEQLTKKGLDDIAKSIAAYKEEYLTYWNLITLEMQASFIDEKQIATLREKKQQWMKALQLRAAEQRQIVDDARKEAVRVALEEGTNRIVAQQQFAKSYLPDDLVHQIERSRAKIDELSGRLTKIEWLMDGSQLQMIIDAKTGVYVTRSYEAFETTDRVGYVNWLDEAYRALYDPKQDYDPLAKERIMPLVRHLKNNIIERRIEDLKLENEQRQVDEIMADLMTDPRQVTQVEMVPGQSTEGTEYEELVRAVAKRELLRRRSEEKKDFIRRAMRSLALNGFASNIRNARKRLPVLRKEANRLYDQRYPEQVAVAGIMGAPNALRYTLMTDDEAHDIANTERAISENPGSVNGSEIWTASISGEKHSSFYAAVNDDFRQNLDFITGAPSSKTGFSGATANDWKRLGDKILEHKNDVPAFLRTFLGERDNPLLRVSDTLLKQSHLIAVGELYQNLAKTGMAQGWIVDRGTLSLDGKKYAGWKTILDSEKTNQGYENNPFSGKYIDPVMADAINVMLAANQPSNSAFKAVAKFVGFALWGVTAGSVKAIIRNLLSAPSFLLNSGFLATILDPRRLRSTAQNVALASIVMKESMSSVAKVSGGKKVDNTVLKGLDWAWTGLLTIAASQRTATGVMKGVGTVGEFISQMKSKPTSEAAQQFYSLAVRLGVANDNVQKEAMERLLSLEETISRQPRDKNLGRFAKSLKLDGVVGFGSYLLDTIKSAGQQRSQLYGAPDDFTKILAWLNEMDSQARIHAKDTAQYKEWKGADGLFTNMPENLVKLAADHTTDTIQSHSKVWAHITQFKKAGFGVLLAPFVAARAEFYRNAINAYRIGFQELRSKNGKERSYGAMRIASAFLAHTVYAKAAGIALSMIFKAMADDDDVAEDSPEKREAIRKLGPEYAKNKNATYVVYKNGTFDWLDISFSDPFSFVSSSLNAARRGIDEKAVDDHVAWSVAKELMAENFGTFVSPQIAVGASATMISGYDPVRGIKIWDSQADTTAEKVQKAIAYYAKQAGTPGDVKSAMNIIKAARGIEENGRQYKLGTEVGGVFLGASVRTIKVTDMVEQKLAQAKDNLNTRISALYDAQLNDSNIHTDEDFVGPAETYHRVGQDAIRRMQKVWKAGETLLSDTPGGQKMLNAVMESDKVKMSEVIERAIKTGKNVPSTLSPQTKQKIGDLGKKHGDDRLPITEDTLKRLNQKP